MSPDRADRPVRKTAENCAVDRSETNGRPVLRGETMATLEAPPLDDSTAGTSAHPDAKSVLALATPHIGLIGTLHSEVSPLGRSRCDREDFGRLNSTSLPGLSATSSREREVERRSAKSRRRPRNIVVPHSGGSPALLTILPLISNPFSPYAPRVFAACPLSSIRNTAGFPPLAAAFPRDI